jgi:hypothetical protein
MSSPSKRTWLLWLTLPPVALACGGGDGTGVNPLPPVIEGAWIFRELLADPGNGFTCQDNGVLTIVQGTGGFSGDYQQTGACSSPSGPSDNSGSFAIIDGAATGTTVSFTQPGAVPCIYRGSITGTPPDALSGTVACDGTLQAVQFHFAGTWRADAVGGGPTPGGNILLTITTTGSNLPASMDVEVSTDQGLIAIYSASPNGNSNSPVLMSGDYEVSLMAPGNCQVTGTNPISVNIGASPHGLFTVTCT